MPYPITDRPVWQTERTTLLWVALETTHPDPDQGMIVEMSAAVTRWDLTPVTWTRNLVRPVVLNWADVARPERAALYEKNGLITDLGRNETVNDATRGENVTTVMTKLSKWWYHSTALDQVPVVTGPHAALTLAWLHRWGDVFGKQCHPVPFDTFPMWEWATHHMGMADPIPDKTYGRAAHDLYRNLAALRHLAGLPPVAFPERFDQVQWTKKDPSTW